MIKSYGFIYIWFDKKRKMYYIGSHFGNIGDKYICSSNRMRDAYRRRPQDFRRRILRTDLTRENILDEEHRWLSMISDKELGHKYYNLRKHKWGHWASDENSRSSVSEKISKSKLGKPGPKHTEESKSKIREARLNQNHPFLGHKHSDASKEKMRKPKPLRTEEHKKNLSAALLGQTAWNKGKVLKPDTDNYHTLYMREYRQGLKRTR